MNGTTILTIWLKELKDTTRDRRTVGVMVIMPVVIIPFLILGMAKFSQYQQQQAEAKTVIIAVAADQQNQPILQAIATQDKLELTSEYLNLETAVQDELVDAAIRLPENVDDLIQANQPIQVSLIQKSIKDITAQAQLRVTAGINQFNAQLIEHRLDQQQIDPTVLVGATVAPVDVASSQEKSGFGLSFILPLFMVMWAITGGMYTAIDASAGEKERKTLEALLLTPSSRLDIVVGKFLAVASVSLASIMLSLISLYLSFRYLFESLAAQNGLTGTAFAQLNIADSLTAQAIALMMVTSILLAMLFAAILLTAGIFAKSFREAQSYISPIYLVAIIPVAAINATPNFTIPQWLFLIPPINAVQLYKELLKGMYEPTHIMLTLVSLGLASAIAMMIATRIFQQEKILFKQ